MTQEEINKYFKTSLGEQCDELYSTSDDRVFIRFTEADLHRQGKLDENTKPLEDQTIQIWYNPYEG